jgi:hypothetical protein
VGTTSHQPRRRIIGATRTWSSMTLASARSSVVGDEPTAAHTLYIDGRHGQVSTAVTSNIALSEWGRYLGDATLTAAILDRLAMHAIRINIAGPSFR